MSKLLNMFKRKSPVVPSNIGSDNFTGVNPDNPPEESSVNGSRDPSNAQKKPSRFKQGVEFGTNIGKKMYHRVFGKSDNNSSSELENDMIEKNSHLQGTLMGNNNSKSQNDSSPMKVNNDKSSTYSAAITITKVDGGNRKSKKGGRKSKKAKKSLKKRTRKYRRG